MLELPSVTLFCADCVDSVRAIKAIERCKSVCNFGAVKFLTSLPTDYEHKIEIPKLPSLCDYSIFMLKRAPSFIETKHALIVQHDGYILNVDSWNPAWLNYDYIGPLFIQDHAPQHMVGSGGFSFRSKSLMQFVQGLTPDWDGSPESTECVQEKLRSYEDGWICHIQRNRLEREGFKFASIKDAATFAQGGWPQPCSPHNFDRSHYVERPFGHHGQWANIDLKTGFVSPPPFTPFLG